MINIEIPVKNYVKVYLESHFKSKEIPLKCDTAIGKFFYGLLKDGSSLTSKKQQYNSVCVFVIKEKVFVKKGFIIDDNGVIQFNTFIEDLLKRELFAIIDIMIELQKMEFRKAILKACEKMNLDESAMPYETIKKAYYRHRNKKGTEN